MYIFYCNHLTEKSTSTTEVSKKRNDFNSGQKNYFHEVMQWICTIKLFNLIL